MHDRDGPREGIRSAAEPRHGYANAQALRRIAGAGYARAASSGAAAGLAARRRRVSIFHHLLVSSGRFSRPALQAACFAAGSAHGQRFAAPAIQPGRDITGDGDATHDTVLRAIIIDGLVLRGG